MFRFLLLLLLCFLSGCGQGNEAEKKNTAQDPPKSVVAAVPAPDPKEQEKAAIIVNFSNRAKEALSSGYHALPDIMAQNTRYYLKNWRLPPRKPHALKDPAAFHLPEHIFTDEEARELDAAYEGMDRALNNVLANYAALEKYIADKTIRDDGEKGRSLAGKIEEFHGQFIAARQSWLGIIDKKSAEAEELLLRTHPLQRQVLAAQRILTQFREVSSILATGSPQPAMLGACLENIKTSVEEGSKPPFPAAPAVERPYRDFLKSARTYMEALDELIQYGAHTKERQNLNHALLGCQKNYNTFAQAANAN